MTTTDKEKAGGKPRQRSPKGSQRGQKAEPQYSPKPDQREEDRILSAMAAPIEVAANGAAAPASEPVAGEVAPADVLSIGPGVVAPADAFSIAVAPADDCPFGIQTLANAYADYTRKSLQESRSFAEKLMGVRSFDSAIEVQTEFARQALANFVADSQKICELYGKLAAQIFRPWGGLAAREVQPGR